MLRWKLTLGPLARSLTKNRLPVAPKHRFSLNLIIKTSTLGPDLLLIKASRADKDIHFSNDSHKLIKETSILGPDLGKMRPLGPVKAST